MTVSSTTNRRTYGGNNSTTSFATSPIIFFDTDDLTIYVTDDVTNDTTLLVENTDYTVTGGDGSTGTVSLAGGSVPYGAPAVNTTLVIVRELDLVQETDFQNNDVSDAEVLEDALDKLTLMAQQLQGQIDRVIRLPDSDVSGADVTLPLADADKYIGWNADGDGLENKDITMLAEAPVTAFMGTVLSAANAASAATTLNVLALTGGTLTSTDATAAGGPRLELDRNSATPAASDVLGQLYFLGRDSGNNSTTYARLDALIVDATNGSEDGRFRVATTIAGTTAARFFIGAGIYSPSADGGDQGAETLNFQYIYQNGSPLRATPATETGASRTLSATDNEVIANRAGTVTLTLPLASLYPGRVINVKTIQAQTVVSAASDVVPLIGGSAGTAILAGTAGKWARLVSDATNWIIMAGN